MCPSRRYSRSRVFICLARTIVMAIVAWCALSLQGAWGATSADTASAIRLLLAQAHAPDIDLDSMNLSALRSFYARRSFEPAWTGSAAAESEAQTLVAALENADQDGLDPLDYHADLPLFRAAPTTPIGLAERDIVLADGALSYARDLRAGRPDLRSLDHDVDLPDESFDAIAALDAVLKNGSLKAFLTGLAPPQPEYRRLKEALARYRQIVANGGWRELPPTMDADVDDANADTEALRERLAFEDSQAGGAQSGNDLSDALKRFQDHHGLDADGRVGRRTLEALNIPASERAMQIVANMERWRWLPRSLEPVRVQVNVPDGRLDIFSNGESVLSSRVIVGKPKAPTPILRAVAKSVTINPPWNVPTDIARREILAKLRRNPDYLLSENMILLNGPPGDPYGRNIDWRAMASFPYRVRQLPGPKNALGQIKLELPNRFDVYLHDTPAKAVFDLDERSLSHGCVRVQQILPLASYALSGDANAMVEKLKDAIVAGTTQHIPMSRPLPIYFLYWTAFADSDRSMQFRPDIYGRDQRLIAALGGRAAGQRVTMNPGQCGRA